MVLEHTSFCCPFVRHLISFRNTAGCLSVYEVCFLMNCDWLLKPVSCSVWNIWFSLLWLAIVICISYCWVVCCKVEACTFQYDILYGWWRCNSLMASVKVPFILLPKYCHYFQNYQIFLWWKYFVTLIQLISIVFEVYCLYIVLHLSYYPHLV